MNGPVTKVDRRAVAGLGLLIAVSQAGSLVAATIVKNHPLAASLLTTRPATLLLSLRFATHDTPILAAAAFRFVVGTVAGFALGRRSVNAMESPGRLAIGMVFAAPGPAAGGLAGWRKVRERTFAIALLLGGSLRLSIANELVRRGTFNSNGAIRALEIIQWASLALVFIQIARSARRVIQRRNETPTVDIVDQANSTTIA